MAGVWFWRGVARGRNDYKGCFLRNVYNARGYFCGRLVALARGVVFGCRVLAIGIGGWVNRAHKCGFLFFGRIRG